MKKWLVLLSIVLLALTAAGCGSRLVTDLLQPTETPTVVPATATARVMTATTAPPSATVTMAPPTATMTAIPPTHTYTPAPTATFTPAPPTETATATVPSVNVLPTFTPVPGDQRVSVEDLPLGEPGNYVNTVFGYRRPYPEDWYTGFGNRPLLVSFTNLEPGLHNRDSLRAEGCLFEVNASVNVYALNIEGLRGQLARSFEGATYFDLGGEIALRLPRSSEHNTFDSEWVYVEHNDHWFIISGDYSKSAGDACLPAWEGFLASWEWFEPQMATYRNPTYGYAIQYPLNWHRFNPTENGIWISDQDPSGMTSWPEYLNRSMVIRTTVSENPNNLPLKEWIAAQDWDINLTTEIPLGSIIGIRVRKDGLTAKTEEVTGYFQGPQGRFYGVFTSYPIDMRAEYRSIVNAVIYSFTF